MIGAEQVYADFCPKVRAYVRGKVRNPHDALDALSDALLALKEKERDLIVLHDYMGHTLKAAAEMMGMSYINAKVVHKKALTSLRLIMGA